MPSSPPNPADRALIDRLRTADTPCPSCGYNLRGLTVPACPECGTEITLERLRRGNPRRVRLRTSPAFNTAHAGIGLTFAVAGAHLIPVLRSLDSAPRAPAAFPVSASIAAVICIAGAGLCIPLVGRVRTIALTRAHGDLTAWCVAAACWLPMIASLAITSLY